MQNNRLIWLCVFFSTIILTGGILGYKKITTTEEKLSAMETTNLQLASELANTKTTLETTIDEFEVLQEDYADLEENYNDYVDEYGDAIEQAKDLAKLATIDKEVLLKYSKASFLNENYTPRRIREIDTDYILTGRQTQFFADQALPFLEEMLEEAADDGIDLKIVSAYRSFDTQSELKGQYLQTYGTGANSFSADQGFSEHQLGTTVDFSDSNTGGLYTSFEKTETFRWLERNAYKYGFILSYPKENSYYMYEPWHWRFVGEDLARDLRRGRENFYDLDQRDINEYLLEVFD